MADNPNTVDAVEAGEDILLPDGWSGEEGADIFDPATWGDGSAADALQDTEAGEAGEAAVGSEDQTRTTEEDSEQATAGEDAEDPTTVPMQTPGKLRFKANIDHSERDIELDPSELPAIYQKAQALDRYQNKFSEAEKEFKSWDALARGLNYENRQAMMQGAMDGAIQSYMDEHPGVPEDMARDFITRKFNLEAPERVSAQTADAPQSTRDFKSEVAALFSAYPQARSMPLPDEVTSDALENNKPLVQAYADYQAKAASAKAKNAERENKILKQNQASAAKAPVSKVTGGGKTDTSPEDPFITGFNSDEW